MSHISTKANNTNESSSAQNTRSCPLALYGCEQNLKRMSVKDHYVTEQHQKCLIQLAQQIIQKKESNSSTDTDAEQVAFHLHNYYDSLSTLLHSIETLSNELLRVDLDAHQLKTQLSTFVENINEIEEANLSEKAHVNGISVNQSVLTQDVSNMKQQLEESKHRIFNGTMVWKISNVRENMYHAQSERQTSIYSPSFYTSATGYNLCVRLYLNGDGTARGTHLSIFLVILRGRYDTLLKWPFTYRVSFCLFDQRTIVETGEAKKAKHIIDSFQPDTGSTSFQRPRSAMNIASGIAKFFPLNDLNQPAEINRYIIDDTIFIKVLIDFIGISRAILPFIFNINMALPIEIQQKLIEDEIKRYEEQTVQ